MAASGPPSFWEQILDRAASIAPELFCRQPSALGHRRQFGPHHVGIDRGLADPGAEAAIAAGDDVVPADEVGVASNALRDQLRVLDEVRFRLDDPWNNGLAFRQLDPLEQGPLMRVARVGGLERDRRRPCREHNIDHRLRCRRSRARTQ